MWWWAAGNGEETFTKLSNSLSLSSLCCVIYYPKRLFHSSKKYKTYEKSPLIHSLWHTTSIILIKQTPPPYILLLLLLLKKLLLSLWWAGDVMGKHSQNYQILSVFLLQNLCNLPQTKKVGTQLLQKLQNLCKNFGILQK